MIDMQRYGGKRAYLTHLMTSARNLAGAYSSLKSVQWQSVQRLVFVCKGNICRSPYAEFQARALGMDAVSFGLEAMEGASADPAAARNAVARDLDISAHRSSRLKRSALRQGDLALLFEPSHLFAYEQTCGDSPAAVTLLGLWNRPSRPYIADPFGKSDRYFQECFSVIDVSMREIRERWRQSLPPG
jgi:protein-tyrosine phosphatase